MRKEWNMDGPEFFSGIEQHVQPVVPSATSRVVSLVSEVHREQEAIFDSLVREFSQFLSDYDRAELRERREWLSTSGKKYYPGAQKHLYFNADSSIAESVEPILLSYSNSLKRLYARVQASEKAERIAAINHLADWLADTPHRFGLRLLQFGIDILASPNVPTDKKENSIHWKKEQLEAVLF